MECPRGAVALWRAAGMARTKAGAVAFGRTGDPEFVVTRRIAGNARRCAEYSR
jgi:hypothetical protein